MSKIFELVDFPIGRGVEFTDALKKSEAQQKFEDSYLSKIPEVVRYIHKRPKPKNNET